MLRDKLFAWRDQLLPKHPMSEAVGYLLNQWMGLAGVHGRWRGPNGQ
jgi:hypothetical protein